MSSPYREDGSLVLEGAAPLPDVLDLLIVGGGPAGTATAFRARELGLAALVVDFDDILKRIRDYPKDKLILPDFGGGDKMRFPAGASCIAALQFGPIDKDDLCVSWRTLYQRLGVPAKIGVELTGLERQPDGTWNAITWNHRILRQEIFRARHVVLGLGRGVPRRFDIPGNTDGVAYKLDDPARFVGGPVCIVGGGTSAAEAVIAISRAKAAKEDPCPVYWSYRGTKMPRVSKALSDEFFEAYVGIGNIRYHPESEPVAVVTGPDRREYLSIRVDRKNPEGRPGETVHLEFLKENCVACIGEDIPERFLKDLGIDMVSTGGEDKGKKMMAVTPLLETQQPNVYLVGDLLSQAYLETSDFSAPVDTYQRVKHRGNIKSSLRDGVFVAEVIKQRLEGRSQIDVVIRDAPTLQQPVGVPGMGTADLGEDEELPVEVEDTGRAAAVGDEPALDDVAFLVHLSQAGVETDQYDLRQDRATTIGRTDCDIVFPQDTLLSADHASISFRDGHYYLRDDGSRSGTWLKVRPGRPVLAAPKSLVRLGRQILLVGSDGAGFHLQQYDAQGKAVGRHSLGRHTVVFGRSGGKRDPDVVLDEDDRTLSRFHVSATVKDGAVEIEDFNSRNGTWLKVDRERRLEHCDVFRVGSEIFEMRLEEDLPQKTGSMPAFKLPDAERAEPSLEPKPAPTPKATIEPHITFKGQDKSGPIDAGSTILEWADENEVEMDYECWIGMCGCDAIRILEGGEHLNEPDEKELKTLKRRGLEPGACRLACMTRCAGPVVVEVIDD